ncbi:DNA polymerase III [Paenibacillus eucommiae]|uniref:Uncharacterized protein n=1 Tax=Paenibacillus eucommiae TaxID=1355755 RepID=A0ABS4IM89_9BACL|nr:DNA polymerase III [Paenibacillus eucommiae]MBP1988688.1 hypothetical protein [Paenibacillus eucommiae]
MENLLLYHRIPQNKRIESDAFLKKEIGAGITSNSPSNLYYTNGGKGAGAVTGKFRPNDIPSWVDFNNAIGVNMIHKYDWMYAFPIFSSQIAVFDREITHMIYDQTTYEANINIIDEAEHFDTGFSLEYLVKMYWEGFILFEDYLHNPKYPSAEILVFESIPASIISVVKK